ncbi:MAG: outer membrane protein assembly factor BamC [Pseudomonadota bacterium]
MSLINQYTRGVLLAALCLTLIACSGGSNSRIDYKEAKTLPDLDVPPDLATPVDTGVDNLPGSSGDAATTTGGGGGRVLPVGEGIRVAHDGSLRWLVIDSEAERLWPRLRQFWASLGLELKRDEPQLGIMESEWAENRADAPGGFLTGLVKSVFKNAYSADTRDKYRIRLEPREDGRTELFLTHYGLKEVVAGQTVEGFVDTAWQVRPSDPELANELLNRLVLFLGGTEQTAEAARQPETEAALERVERARLEGDLLVLDEGFSRAWRLTGLALDRIGLVVEDRNRSAGLYYVSRIDQLKDADSDEQGWFDGLFSDEASEETQAQQWQIAIDGGRSRSRIRVYDENGDEAPEPVRRSILERLQESLR